MQETHLCPICGSNTQYEYNADNDVHIFRCTDPCGSFKVYESLAQFDHLTDKERRYLSIVNRNLNRYDCWRGYRDGGRSTLRDHKTVEAIARAYGFDDAEIAYAGGCEGSLYLIEADEQRYTLRLYAKDYDRVRSELCWLESLKGARIDVLENVPTPDGANILKNNDPSNVERAYAVLYRWIEGRPFQLVSDEEKTSEFIAQFGEFVGRMHEHGHGFEPPEWFVAPHQSSETIQQHIAAAEDGEARKVGEQLLPLINALGDDSYGVVHNDLTSLNAIYGNGRFSAIDWGGFQWGYFATDLALLCCEELTNEQYAPFFDGYRRIRSLSDVFTENVELFKKVRQLGFI